MQRWTFLCGLVALTACGSTPPAVPAAPTSHGGLIGQTLHQTTVKQAAKAPPAEEVGPALFERLVAMVRRYHLFAPQTAKNLGKSWEADLPRLRAEFAAARDDDALEVALFHFGNSLHDVHCQFRAKDRGERLRLGFRVGFERQGEDYQFYVERVTSAPLKGQLEPGDILVSVDGVPGERLVEELDLVSNMNTRENIAGDVAGFLTSRRTSVTDVRAGSTSTWVVRPRKSGPERTVSIAWATNSSGDDGDDFALDYASKDCENADPKDYGNGYTLTARGYRLCIYTSTAPKYRDYPIVRQVSFRYDALQHGVLADYELLTRTLAAAKPKGVVLDVQDNHGGVNPNLFLEWWTDKPYTDTETHMLLDETVLRDDKGTSHISSVNKAIESWYAEQLKTRKPEQRVSSGRPFMCKPDTCAWDNHYTPKHRVTKAPVALVLGPGCASSCDALAWHFDKDDIGPIVGRGGMAGVTTHRARFDIAAREGQPPLGTIDFAISYDTIAGGSESIEAVPVTIDVPIARTFENHARFDALLVDGAIRALETRGRKP